jgi:hypothetical protein
MYSVRCTAMPDQDWTKVRLPQTTLAISLTVEDFL